MIIKAGLLAAVACLASAAVAPGEAFALQESVDITKYGATADDETDDTDAIKRAIVAAGECGKAVFVPAGVFRHNDVLFFQNVGLTGTGPASVLRATNDKRMSLQFSGSDITVRDVKLVSEPTTRGTRLEHHRLVINKVDGFVVDGVEVDGASGSGIFDYGGKHGVIRNSVVKNTKADGIHNTLGASDLLIEDNLVTGTGDDMIAVVSYGTGDDYVNDVVIRENLVFANRQGRGISVVGGVDILIERNVVKDPHMAGIYVASEEGYGTNRVEGLTVQGNTVLRAGSSEQCTMPDQGGCGQGAIHVFANHLPITSVVFEGNRILESRNYAVHLNGIFGQYRNPQRQDVTFSRNRFIGAGADALYVSDSFRGAARFTGNRVWGVQGFGLRYEKPVEGSALTASGNLFAEITGSSVVKIEQGSAQTVEVTGNRHSDLPGRPAQYFVEEYVDAPAEDYTGNLTPSPSFVNGVAVRGS